jgi:hypothetical protein
MSLRTLVEFAQENFGVLWQAPGARVDETKNPEYADIAPRPPVPEWIGETDERDVPFDGSHPWRIEGPIDPQQPPPEMERIGSDALAFWVPFHFYRERWGIYIRLSGVRYLASVLKGGRLLPGDEEYLHIAEAILFEHERTHATIEIACTRAEMVARRSLYQEYFADRAAAEHEEAISNAQATLWALDINGGGAQVRARAEAWMRRQGPGYRDFGNWVDSRKLSRGMDRAAHFMLKPLPAPHPKASGPSKTFLFHEAKRYAVPAKRINDLPPSHVSVLRPLPKKFGIQILVHSNDHAPPHIHIQMPPGGAETKYIWPDLVPVKNQKPLPSGGEKSLRRYLESHRAEVEERLRRVYGTRLVTRTEQTEDQTSQNRLLTASS